MDYLNREFEPPEKKSTGWWIPIEVVRLFEKEVINAKEMILLSLIDSLSKQEDDSGNFLGCFASNSYLARNLQIKDPTTVSKMVSKLKSLDLLIEESFDGRKRFLFTRWAHSLRRGRKRHARLG